MRDPAALTVCVTELAYQDVVNVPVIGGRFDDLVVPEPGSLSILAVGAVAVLAFRRRRQAVESRRDDALAA